MYRNKKTKQKFMLNTNKRLRIRSRYILKREVLPSFLEQVSAYYGIPISILKSKNSTRKVVMARQMFCKLAYEEGKKVNYITTSIVGGIVGIKPCTVLHCLKVIEDLFSNYDQIKYDYESLKMIGNFSKIE